MDPEAKWNDYHRRVLVGVAISPLAKEIFISGYVAGAQEALTATVQAGDIREGVAAVGKVIEEVKGRDGI